MLSDTLNKIGRYVFSCKTMVFYDFSYDRFVPGYVSPQDGFIVRQLGLEGVSALAEILRLQASKETLFEPAFGMADARARLQQGEYCLVCENGGNIVGYLWFCSTSKYIPEIESTLVLEPGEVYVYNAYVVPNFRGKDIVPRLYKVGRSLLADRGFKREVIARMKWNQSPERVLSNKVNAIAIGDVSVGFFLTFRYVQQRCRSINLVSQGSPFEFYKKLFSKISQHPKGNFTPEGWNCLSMHMNIRLPMEGTMILRAKIKKLFSKVFNSLYSFAYLLSRIRKRIWVLTGKEKNSGDHITLIYAGTVINKNYIRRLIFGDEFQEQYIEKRCFWNILQGQDLNRFNGSIIVLEVEKEFKEHLPKEGSFLIPCWLSGELDLSKDLAKTVSTNIKRNIKKIVEKNLSYEIQNEMRDFDNFYHTMYYPYVNRRYSDEAIVWSYEDMKKEFAKCIHLLVRREKDEIAGTLINIKEEIPRLWVIGIKDGNFELVKEGAMHAIWYFFFKYFEEKGIRRVSLGYTRSFFDDGVLQYKKQWGMKIAGTSREYFCVKPLVASSGVESFLRNNPFIYEDGGKFKGAIFEAVEDFSESELTARYKGKHFIPGLEELSIFDSGNQVREVKAWKSRDFNVSIHKIDEIPTVRRGV